MDVNAVKTSIDPGSSIPFVRIIEQYPILYDSSCDRYSDRNLVEMVWLEIAEKLGETVMHCKEKWRNIRSSYTRWLRNKTNARINGRNLKPYYLAKHLQFLDNHTRQRYPSQEKPEKIQIKLEPSNSNDSFGTLDSEDLEKMEETGNRSPEIPFLKCEYEIETEKEKETNKKRKKDFVEEQNSCKKQRQEEEEREEENPTLLFFKSIIPDVNKLNDKQNIQLKLTILEKLNQFLEQNQDSTS